MQPTIKSLKYMEFAFHPRYDITGQTDNVLEGRVLVQAQILRQRKKHGKELSLAYLFTKSLSSWSFIYCQASREKCQQVVELKGIPTLCIPVGLWNRLDNNFQSNEANQSLSYLFPCFMLKRNWPLNGPAQIRCQVFSAYVRAVVTRPLSLLQ